MESLLTVENLRTYFFTSAGTIKAVDGISFSIERGERLGIVGESGSGKSVTALSILRLVPPPGRIVEGRIFLDRSNLIFMSDEELQRIRGRRIAMIFQEPTTSLNPVFTIGDQIDEAIRTHQPLISAKQRSQRVEELLARVRIADPDRVARSYPHELSGGMRQRAMIAMALSCRPEILIADEPTTALDVTIQAQVLELLREVQEELNMSLILITHDLGVVAETVDRILVMQEGKIVEEGSVGELLRNPRHAYTMRLLNIYGQFA